MLFSISITLSYYTLCFFNHDFVSLTFLHFLFSVFFQFHQTLVASRVGVVAFPNENQTPPLFQSMTHSRYSSNVEIKDDDGVDVRLHSHKHRRSYHQQYQQQQQHYYHQSGTARPAVGFSVSNRAELVVSTPALQSHLLHSKRNSRDIGHGWRSRNETILSSFKSSLSTTTSSSSTTTSSSAFATARVGLHVDQVGEERESLSLTSPHSETLSKGVELKQVNFFSLLSSGFYRLPFSFFLLPPVICYPPSLPSIPPVFQLLTWILSPLFFRIFLGGRTN